MSTEEQHQAHDQQKLWRLDSSSDKAKSVRGGGRLTPSNHVAKLGVLFSKLLFWQPFIENSPFGCFSFPLTRFACILSACGTSRRVPCGIRFSICSSSGNVLRSDVVFYVYFAFVVSFFAFYVFDVVFAVFFSAFFFFVSSSFFASSFGFFEFSFLVDIFFSLLSTDDIVSFLLFRNVLLAFWSSGRYEKIIVFGELLTDAIHVCNTLWSAALYFVWFAIVCRIWIWIHRGKIWWSQNSNSYIRISFINNVN